jgi:hypothetical protein
VRDSWRCPSVPRPMRIDNLRPIQVPPQACSNYAPRHDGEFRTREVFVSVANCNLSQELTICSSQNDRTSVSPRTNKDFLVLGLRFQRIKRPPILSAQFLPSCLERFFVMPELALPPNETMKIWDLAVIGSNSPNAEYIELLEN